MQAFAVFVSLHHSTLNQLLKWGIIMHETRPAPFLLKHLIASLKDIDEHWKILAISIIILIVFGILPSYWVNDWGWFSRSGALLVIYGIYRASCKSLQTC